MIEPAPGGEAARDLWILLRAAGLDARLTPAGPVVLGAADPAGDLALGQAQRLAGTDTRSVAPQRDLAARCGTWPTTPSPPAARRRSAPPCTATRERLGAWLATTGDRSAARALFRRSLSAWRRASTLDAGREGRARGHWLEALDLAEPADAEAPAPRHAAETYEMRSQASAAHPG